MWNPGRNSFWLCVLQQSRKRGLKRPCVCRCESCGRCQAECGVIRVFNACLARCLSLSAPPFSPLSYTNKQRTRSRHLHDAFAPASTPTDLNAILRAVKIQRTWLGNLIIGAYFSRHRDSKDSRPYACTRPSGPGPHEARSRVTKLKQWLNTTNTAPLILSVIWLHSKLYSYNLMINIKPV